MAPCTIVGLSSARGQKLNGSVGIVKLTGNEALTERVAVIIDGQNDPLSIKLENLELFDDRQTCQVGAGRPHFRHKEIQGVVLNEKTRVITRDVFFGQDAGRAMANLKIIGMYLKQEVAAKVSRGAKLQLLFAPTDLNVARALNRAANGEEQIHLAEPLDTELSSVSKLIRKLKKEAKTTCEFHFCSVRISPDDFDTKHGMDRLEAVKAGAYKIYPCALEKYFDALEVRYGAGKSETVMIRQEIYLDYGSEEAINYVKHAVALGETMSLLPECLAKRDPQAFWSAVLHLDDFFRTLKTIKAANSIIESWETLVQGSKKSQEYWLKGLSRGLSPKVQGDDWGIDNDAKHKKLSIEYAMSALTTVLSAVQPQSPSASVNASTSVNVDLLEDYKGTELGRYFLAFGAARQKEKDYSAKGKSLDPQKRDKVWNKAFAENGFGSDAMDTASDPLASCGECRNNKRKLLKECGRCGGVVYCSKECQEKHWKSHKKDCSPVLAQVNRSFRKLSMENGGITFTAGKIKASGLLSHTKSGIMSEATAVGSTGIMINPGNTSFLIFNNNRAEGVVPDGSSQLANSLKFKDLSELPVVERFLVACGPLPDIEVAQETVESALHMVGGDLEALRIRGGLFTALEWAAKKGNEDIVRWLCTDPRTRGLMTIGSPIGWASYTGEVDVARVLVAHGADPAATHTILWGGVPPLFAAAQNGKLEAMKYLVEELGQDIRMTDNHGKGVKKHIKDSPNWSELKGHKECMKWAKEKLNQV
jgi:hypothetical protein